MSAATVRRAFHRQYYASEIWKATRWLGVPVQKTPLDLWMYQELLTAYRPEWIIETGTLHGGSALYLATVCEALDSGQVVTIDRTPQPMRPRHSRITYFRGNSVAPEMVARVRQLVSGAERVMVILDADHAAAHVLDELRAYAPLVPLGGYCVVEDTNLGHEVVPDFGPGPREAVAAYLREDKRFVVDRRCEKFLLTFCPGGWLWRRA